MPISARRYGSSVRCGDWSGDASASSFSASLEPAEQVRHRQFRAELVHLLQIVFEDHRRLPRDGGFKRRAGDVRIAVAIAADPASHLEERRQARGQAVLGERVFDVGVERGDFGEEGRAVIGERVLDFIADGQARVAQHPRLPERRDACAQQRFVVRALAGRQFLVALGEQARDVVLRVENALALDFGRVRGEYGDDQRVVEEFLQQPFCLFAPSTWPASARWHRRSCRPAARTRRARECGGGGCDAGLPRCSRDARNS